MPARTYRFQSVFPVETAGISRVSVVRIETAEQCPNRPCTRPNTLRILDPVSRAQAAPERTAGLPRISEFFGIAIYVYYDDHPPPHFHAQYAEFEATIQIGDLRVGEGALSPLQ